MRGAICHRHTHSFGHQIEYLSLCNGLKLRLHWEIKMVQINAEIDKGNNLLNASSAFDERFRTLVEDLSTGVVVYDSNKEIIYSNDAASTLLGLKREQMHPSYIRDDKTLMSFEDHPVGLACRLGHAVDNQVIGIVRSDRNTPVWILGSARPEFNDDGKLSQVIFNFSDITREKELKEKLIEQKKLFDVALNQTHAGIIIVDARTKKVKHLNHAGIQMFGANYQEAEENIDIGELLSPWEMRQLDGTPLPKDEIPLFWSIAHGKEMSRELILRQSGFADRSVWMNVVPISNPDGALVAVVGIIFDTTAHYNLEKDLIGLKEIAEMKSRFLDIAAEDRQFY